METNPSCTEVLSAVPLFVGGDLDAPEARAIERHLAGCGPCRAELERARDARSALLGLGAATPPLPEIWSGLRRRMIDEGLLAERAPLAPTPAPTEPARASRFRRWIPAAAAALLLGALGLLWQAGGGADEADPRAPETPVAEAADPGAASPEPVAAEPRLAAPDRALAHPVALRPLAFDEWPADFGVEPQGSRPAVLQAPSSSRAATPASLPPGIH